MPDKTPCDILADLEAVRLSLLTEGGVKVIRNRSASGVERETHFHPQNLPALENEIRRYRDLCDRSRGGRGRFAIRAG